MKNNYKNKFKTIYFNIKKLNKVHAVYFLLFIIVLMPNLTMALAPMQVNFTDSTFQNELCGFDDVLKDRLQNIPGYQQLIDSTQNELSNYISLNLLNSRQSPSIYTIPVVVHVIYKTGEAIGTGANISYAQIQSQINAMNAAFANDYPIYNTQGQGARAVNTTIKFCLAKNTPVDFFWTNTSEPGVMKYEFAANDPIHEHHPNDADRTILLIGAPAFPYSKYLNIWLVSKICTGGAPCMNPGINGIIDGYASLPTSGTSTLLDGIVCRLDCFGDNTVPGSPVSFNLRLQQGKVMAHEAGHYLNLFHTWGNADGAPAACYGMNFPDPPCTSFPCVYTPDACNYYGDKCCDTPPSSLDNDQCGKSPNSCTEVYNNSDQIDQIENYLSYSGEACVNTFTQDQSYRMVGTLTGLKNGSPIFPTRYNLWQSDNLTSAGVINTENIDKCECCKLTADFYIDPIINCPGNCVKFFIPDGPGFCATSWSWEFYGGIPATFTSINPLVRTTTVCFPDNDMHMVTLTVSDPTGNSIVKTLPVTINGECCPIITARNNSPVCVGDVLQFYASSRNGNTTYNWQGPSALPAVENPILSGVTMANARTYIVTVPAVNGCPNTATTTVFVKPDLAAPNSVFLCNNPITLFSNDPNAHWTFPNTTTVHQENLILPVSADLGRYYVRTADYWTKRADVPDFDLVDNKGRMTASAFSIGEKGYLGIGDSRTKFPNDFWEFTQASGSPSNNGIWSAKQFLPGSAGLRGAVSFSIGGKGYFGTGDARVEKNTHYLTDHFWEYDAVNDTWTQKANVGGGARFLGSGFSIGNKGYIGFGENSAGTLLSDFWEYDRETNSWTQKKSAGFPSASLQAPKGRTYSVSFSIGNNGYISTGLIKNGSNLVFLDDIWEFNPIGIGTWTQKTAFPGGARYGAVGFNIGCKGYLGTGILVNGTYKKDFWAFDPLGANGFGTWTRKADFDGDPRYLAVGFSIGNKGYIGTGQKAGTPGNEINFISDFWEYEAEACGECRYSSFVDVFPCTSCKSYCASFDDDPTLNWHIIEASNSSTSTLSIPFVSNRYLQFNQNDESHLIETNNLFTGRWCCGEFSYDYQIFNDGHIPGPEYPVIYIKSNGKGFKFTSSTAVTRIDGWVKIRVPINDCQFNSTSDFGTWEPIAGTEISDWFNVLSSVNHFQFEVLKTSPNQREVRFDNICLTPDVPTFSIDPSSCNGLCCNVTHSCCQTFSYKWSDGPPTQCISNVIEGNNYIVVITDQHGTTYTKSITAPPQLKFLCFGGFENNCSNDPTSSQISFTVSGGTGMKITTVHRNSLTGPVVGVHSSQNDDSFLFNGVGVGHYCAEVVDQNGCTRTCCCDVVYQPDFCENFESGLNGWQQDPGSSSLNVFISTVGSIGGSNDHYLATNSSGNVETKLDAGLSSLGKWCCGEFSFDMRIYNTSGRSGNDKWHPMFEITDGTSTFIFTSSEYVDETDWKLNIRAPISGCGFNETSDLGTWAPVDQTVTGSWSSVISNITAIRFIIPPHSSGADQIHTGIDNVCFKRNVTHFYFEVSNCKDILCIKTDGCCKTITKYLWSTNSTLECISGINEGAVYYVTVTDQENNTYTTSIIAPPRLHLHCFDNTVNCSNIQNKGNLAFYSTGGTGIKTVILKKGSQTIETVSQFPGFTSYLFRNLSPGHYCAYITDENGCTDFCCCDLKESSAEANPNDVSICTSAGIQLHSSNALPAPKYLSDYTFVYLGGGGFNPIFENGGNVVSGLKNDDAIVEVPIGFPFVYEGVSYSSLSASSNGFLSFGSFENNSTNNLDASTIRNVIAPLWDNLSGISIDGVDTAYGTPSYLTTGVTPDRIFTFEWLNWYWDNSAINSSISFQAKLFESDSHIEFIYRQESGIPSNASASIGLSGSFVGDYLSLDNSSASPNANSLSETNTISTKPATGQVYKFTPPPPDVVSYSWSPAESLNDPTSPNPFATPPIGTTRYTVTVTNGNCSASATATITSGQAFVCSPATIGSASACSGTTFSVTAHSTGGGEPFNYAWTDGVGGVYPNAQSISANLAAGSYTFECLITDGCGDPACISSVTVIVNQSPSASISPPGPVSICSNSVPIQLIANTDFGNMYQWSRNGIDLIGQTGSALSVSFSGTYNVTVSQSSSGTWTQKSNVGGMIRYHAPGFSIGNKGYCGAGYNGTLPQKDFWEYDPSNDTWTQKADFGGTARNDATGFSIGDKGYIGLGRDVTGERNDFWEYDPISNSWTQRANFGGVARARATGFGIGTKGYIGLGETAVYYNDFWEYDQATDVWTQMSSFPGTPRGAAVGFSIGSKGYIGTGWGGSHKRDFWEYDPLTNTWIQKANFGGIGREFAAGFSIGNKGYIGTGADNFLKDFWEYNQSSDTWIRKADFAGSARYSSFGFSIGNKGYIGAGRDGIGIKNDFWEYNPGSECSSTSSVIVTVIQNASPPIDVLPANINASVGATSSINYMGSCSPLAGQLDWYNVPVGGTLLSSTSSFNPITDGGVSTATPGIFNFYAECPNGGCSSARTHVTFTVVADGIVTISANIFLEGYYIGGGLMNNTLYITGVSPNPLDADTIFVSAMDPNSPFAEVDRQPGILKTNGDIIVTFGPAVILNNSYYLKLNHRNSVETWSAAPVLLNAITTYSFSSAVTQAFASNEAVTFDALYAAIYTGDINQDGAVDVSDFLELDPSIQNGDGGYAIGDLNGDGAVDVSDFLVLDPNIQGGIGANIPTP